MANTKTVDKPPQLVASAAFDLSHDLGGVLLPKPTLNLTAIRANRRARQVGQLIGGQRVDVRVIANQLAADQLGDQRLTQTVDVHRRARGEMLQPSLQLRW